MKNAARDNAIGVSDPMTSGIEEMAAVDDSFATSEEVQDQVERRVVEMKAFENRISAASAEKWIRNGRIRG